MSQRAEPRLEIAFEGRAIGPGQPCFILAEVGINHNGDPDMAMAMVDAIADAGADGVKFQTFSAEEFCNGPDEMYEYVSQGKVVKESMLEMFKRLELAREEFARLFRRARERKLIPLSTPTDRAAVDLLETLGAGAFKIGSDDLVYSPFLDYVARKGRPIILSTGMADEADTARAVSRIRAAGNERLILLHCVSEYPAPDASLNLRKMTALAERFGTLVGYSDHSIGSTAAAAAVTLGACMIEKHFTLDHGLPGPDHRFSSDPSELKELVGVVRRVEKSLGQAKLVPTAAEREMALLARRSIVAARDIPRGHLLSDDDLAYRRPGTGLMPYERERIVGRRARQSIAAGTAISFSQIESGS